MPYHDFERLCEQRGVRSSDVARATGIPAQTFSAWKKGLYTPKPEKLTKIAAYFDVPVDYLITGEMPTYYTSDDAREMAEFLFHNPDYKVLFDASRRVKREDLEVVKAILDRFGGDDDVD